MPETLVLISWDEHPCSLLYQTHLLLALGCRACLSGLCVQLQHPVQFLPRILALEVSIIRCPIFSDLNIL